jgi:hypothetical protein
MYLNFDRMRKPKIKSDVLHRNDYYGVFFHSVRGDVPAMSVRPALGRMLFGLFPALAMVLLVGCSSGGNDTSSSQTPVTVPTGSVSLTARTKPVTTNLVAGRATPDSLTLDVNEAAISTDDSSYESLVTNAGVMVDAQGSPDLGDISGLATGTYKALKLTISNLAWNTTSWTFSNPSPCDGTASGSGSGSLGPNAMTLYFKTADLGGNTAQHYQSNPPLSGYAGDVDHPYILPAPIQVIKDETTKVSLVMDTEHTIGCSHLSVFSSTDSGDVAPLREIVGSATQLFDVSGLAVDSYRNQIAVTNGQGGSLTIYARDGVNDVKPVRSIDGPGTRLNYPAASALYLGLNPSTHQPDHSGDQYIVLNRDNDSIVTFAWDDSGNVTPLRTIWGLFAGLNQPTGLALNLDPFGDGDPNKDEILVANNGNDTVTSYTRVGNGDTFPLRTLGGALTGLNRPCGVGIYHKDTQHQEVFVTNSNNNTITVYDLRDLDGSRQITDPNTGGVLTSPHINIPPLLTIGSSAGLAEPCGIAVDSNSANPELIVANKGSNTISVFDLNAIQTAIDDPNTSSLPDLAVKRSITGASTGLVQPNGVQLDGGELWVTQNGGQAVLAQFPQIIPAVSNESATINSALNGEYNIVQYGIDFHKGINGFGSAIPVIHAERGVASFNIQSPTWPHFTLQRDAGVKQFNRQVMEPGCGQPDLNTKDGFFGVAADNSFYAFTQDNQEIFNGSFLASGEDFAGVSFSGDEMYVIYGVKSSGASVPYMSEDGTDTGGPANYSYASYTNYFQSISRFLDTPKSDLFENLLDVGYLSSQPTQFFAYITSTSPVLIYDPVGEYQAPQTLATHSRLSFRSGSRASSPTAVHAGGLFENPGYGIAGAVSSDSQSFIFINDITNVDADNCQTTGGIGMGLRQQPAGTFKTQDIKGTYYIAGVGDDFVSSGQRTKYFSMAGTISFDGGGSATMVQTHNSEGEVTSTTNTYSYQVVPTAVPGGSTSGAGPDNLSTDVLTLYSSGITTTPYASALIGKDGKILSFYQSGNTRLLGVGLLQK